MPQYNFQMAFEVGCNKVFAKWLSEESPNCVPLSEVKSSSPSLKTLGCFVGILVSKCLWVPIHFATKIFLRLLSVRDFGIAQIYSLHEIYMKTLFI